MSRVPKAVVDPKQPQGIVDYLYRVASIVDGHVEFGHPQDPSDPASTTLANGTTHNGTVSNMFGSWVEVDVAAADTRVDFQHNLGIPVTVVATVNQPNVRVLDFLFRHSGAGVNAASTMSYNYDVRDAASITTISFPLRFYFGGTRTVAAGANAVRACFYFTPAVR